VDVTETDQSTADQHEEAAWVPVGNPRRVRL
jgi:hypothetical protein